jgi:hypothetical protein
VWTTEVRGREQDECAGERQRPGRIDVEDERGARDRAGEMQATDVVRRPTLGFDPPASVDSDASLVRVLVRTVVVMSRTPVRWTAAFRIPTENASSARTM